MNKKTNPIGVRFPIDLLDVFIEDKIADSPQKALNYLVWFYSKYKAGREGNIDFTETVKDSKLFKKNTEKELTVDEYDKLNWREKIDYRNKLKNKQT